MLSLDEEPRTQPVVATQADESSAVLSPNGRWLAYQSDQPGRYEIFVTPFPDPDKRWQVSTLGGSAPMWGPTGDEIYYWNGNRFMRVPVRMEPEFRPRRPKFYSKDISSSGRILRHRAHAQRFLMLREEMGDALRHIRVVQAWTEELDRLVPTP